MSQNKNTVKSNENPYGSCPQCGAKGVMRERRINGNDRCVNGHTYPSSQSVSRKFEGIDRWRALKSDKYYFVSGLGKAFSLVENGSPRDDSFYQIGNYFKTEDQARGLAAAFRGMLKQAPTNPQKYHGQIPDGFSSDLNEK